MVKVSADVLERVVFRRLGTVDPDVVVGPRLGEDAAVIRLVDGKYLVVHSDPISGAVENIGWLSIYIPANDIAVRGVRPRWFLLTLLLPEGYNEEAISLIMDQVHGALMELGASLVGGHTEYAPGLNRPLASSTAMGIAEGFVTTGGAKVGDLVLVTKYVALEASSILATDFRHVLEAKGVPSNILDKASGFIREVSVVKEALAIADLVTSMHDPTEGGLLQGLLEVALASGKGIRVDLAKVPIREETKVIFETMGLDPLRSLSSGMLLATVPRDKVDEALDRLRGLGINCEVVGQVIDGEPRVELVRPDGVTVLTGFVEDEIMRLWSTAR